MSLNLWHIKLVSASNLVKVSSIQIGNSLLSTMKILVALSCLSAMAMAMPEAKPGPPVAILSPSPASLGLGDSPEAALVRHEQAAGLVNERLAQTRENLRNAGILLPPQPLSTATAAPRLYDTPEVAYARANLARAVRAAEVARNLGYAAAAP
ncbi:hypothetical protein QAD02_023463 [Eretmocerus hayati]|uniref:Uncharacterized protein n=1 Tax=Eretmocerus hayati TaxID=131215 RepID=A0ACC2PVN1_9HYME|nr:hypothetical protein QAD02_023463 [Eretmocerus hayati]